MITLAIGFVGLGIAAIASEFGGSKAQPPKPPQQVAAEKSAAERTLAKARINQMRFMCIAGAVCQTDPVGHALPIFIYAMDENLLIYLQDQGYTDSWSDNAGFVSGHAWEGQKPLGEKADTFVQYKSPELKTDTEQEEQRLREPAGESGLIYTPPRSEEYQANVESGPLPAHVPPEGQWVITWRLKAPSGHIVKELHYVVTVISCPESDPESGECADPVEEQRHREEALRYEEYDRHYSPAPPPLFPNT